MAWHPLHPEHATPEYVPLYRTWCGTEGKVRLPLDLSKTPELEVWRGALIGAGGRAEFGRVGYGYAQIPFDVEDSALILDIDAEIAAHWLYVVRRKPA